MKNDIGYDKDWYRVMRRAERAGVNIIPEPCMVRQGDKTDWKIPVNVAAFLDRQMNED